MRMAGRKVIAGTIAVAWVGMALLAAVAGKRDRLAATGDRLGVSAVADAAEPEKQAAKGAGPEAKGNGMATLERAAHANKYAFIFFHKDEDEQTSKMRPVFDAATKEIADRAESVAVNIADPSEKGIVDRFGVDRAPMPLVLAVAPSGAITGGFPTQFDKKQIVQAFATPCWEACLGALQKGKLVFVCIQGKEPKQNDAAMKGVRDFKADARFAPATEIVALNPGDEAEAKFLRMLDVDPKTGEAITFLLAPPRMAIGKFTGPTDKDMWISALSSASSGCGSGGCGAGGCGARK